MRDKINRLSMGIIEEASALQLTPESFTMPVFPDQLQSFSLDVLVPDQGSAKGICFADEPRIVCETPAFSGRRAQISFTLNTACLEPGFVLKCSIVLLSDRGEYEIPCRFEVGEDPDAADRKQRKTADQRRIAGLWQEAEKQPFYTLGAGETEDVPGPMTLARPRPDFPEDDERFLEELELRIRDQDLGEEAHLYYQEAIRRGLQLNRLYEVYLLSCRDHLQKPLPKEVLIYFSYEHTLPAEMSEKLYSNILLFEDKSSELYGLYEGTIRDFAIRSVFERRISDTLCVIYDRMIFPGMVDRKAAAILPDILKCHRISLKEPAGAEVVTLRYPGLEGSASFPVKRGRAYVPVYFSDARLLFTDRDGNPVQPEYNIIPLLDRPELIRRCFEMDSSHPVLLFSAVREIAQKGIMSAYDRELCINALKELPLEKTLRNKLLMQVCAAEGSTAFIDTLPPDAISIRTSPALASCLMRDGRLEDALQLLQYTGTEYADAALTGRLAELLLETGRYPKEDGGTSPAFLKFCYRAFRLGSREPHLLDLLAAEYQGGTEEMYQLLQALRETGTALHELPEKLLASQLFAENTAHLAECFRIYTEGDAKLLLVRAFFTLYCHAYFAWESLEADPEIFSALRSFMERFTGPEELPVIDSIGLSCWFSEKERLTAGERELCRKLTDGLIARKLVFAYTARLKNKIGVPEQLRERYYIEYRSKEGEEPQLFVRLKGGSSFAPLAMRRVYGPVWVASVVLFFGEELEYYITFKGSEDVRQRGQASMKGFQEQRREGRYALLNSMSKALKDGDRTLLREQMEGFVRRQEEAAQLIRSYEQSRKAGNR